MAVLNPARRPIPAAPSETNSERSMDLDEMYARGYLTYRELSKRRGELQAETLMSRFLRYFLLASKVPNRVA
jgi:hypothetical protein